MSQQFSGPLVTVGPFAGTSTFSVTAPASMAHAYMWTHGAFGISVTSSMAGATYGVAVWGQAGGVSVKIAEVTGLMGLSAAVIPLLSESNLAAGHVLGSTQAAMIGIVSPRTVVATGVSTGVGITFGCVVTASLFRP